MDVSLFLLASEAGEAAEAGFGLNSNILETNLINLVIILGVLFYAGRGFLRGILSQRLATIESAISDAEKRKQSAIEQLSDRQEKLAQAQAECERLRQQAEADAKVAAEAILSDVAAEIERLKAAAQQEMVGDRERAIIQLRRQVAEKALTGVKGYFDRGLSEHVQHQLVDRSIALLGTERIGAERN